MKAKQMLTLTNMLEKIISEMDDLKAMLKESTLEDFEENFEEDEWVKEVIEILAYILAAVAVLLGTAIALAVTVSILRKTHSLLPKINLPKKEKPEPKERNKMSND